MTRRINAKVIREEKKWGGAVIMSKTSKQRTKAVLTLIIFLAVLFLALVIVLVMDYCVLIKEGILNPKKKILQREYKLFD